MMRKMVLLLAVVGAMVALTAGAALAVTEDAGSGNDTVVGTNGPDKLYGGSGNDWVYGLGGADRVGGGSGNDPALSGGPGRDSISGGSGNDTVYAADGYVDRIECGSGYDWVQRDYFDIVRGCEAAF
jgi:Ca2+-binding RTX toxin-like protein